MEQQNSESLTVIRAIITVVTITLVMTAAAITVIPVYALCGSFNFNNQQFGDGYYGSSFI